MAPHPLPQGPHVCVQRPTANSAPTKRIDAPAGPDLGRFALAGVEPLQLLLRPLDGSVEGIE
jgi:hypothetical protein